MPTLLSIIGRSETQQHLCDTFAFPIPLVSSPLPIAMDDIKRLATVRLILEG